MGLEVEAGEEGYRSSPVSSVVADSELVAGGDGRRAKWEASGGAERVYEVT